MEGALAKPRRNALVLVSDEKIFPAAVFNAARLAQLNQRSDTDVMLFSDWTHGILAATPIYPRVGFRQAKFSNLAAKELPAPERISIATYKRLTLPHELAANYARILYLDVDTFVVSEGLFQLFDLEFGSKVAAAARSIRLNFGRDVQQLRKDRNWQWDVHYNTGVLLIDVASFIERDVARLAFEDAEKNRHVPYYNDEPALNRVLDGQWLEISPRFNMNFMYAAELSGMFPPIVYHFMGPLKFWNTPSPSRRHRARLEFEAFLAGSPWPDFISRQASQKKIWKERARQAARVLGIPVNDRYRSPTLAEAGIDMHAVSDFAANANFAGGAQGLTSGRFRAAS
jgi:lipopolysaccharide biosynthesis glycosyltransferase